MSNTLPDYMTADEFISRLFYLGPYPFGFGPESILEELLKDINCSAELQMSIKVGDQYDEEELWRELYYKHLLAMIGVIKKALIHETMYSRDDSEDGKIDEILDDNETARATTESLAEWFQDTFTVGLPREFPQSANHLQMLNNKFGVKTDFMEMAADSKQPKVGNLYRTIALLIDFISEKSGGKRYKKPKNGVKEINLKTLAGDLELFNQNKYELKSQSSKTLQTTFRTALKTAGLK